MGKEKRREKRSEKGPPVVRTKVILHLLRNEVPRSDYSRCSLATEQPSTTDFRRYQNVSGVADTRQRTLVPFLSETRSPSISLAPLSWPSSLGYPFLTLSLVQRPSPHPRILYGHCRDFHCARQRRRRENRLSEQAVVSNELVGRKLSFARSNLLGP